MRDVAAVLVCLVQRYGLSVSKLDFYGHGSTHEEVEGTTSHAFRFTFCCLELCAAFPSFSLVWSGVFIHHFAGWAIFFSFFVSISFDSNFGQT